MLTKLEIKDFALIEHLEVFLDEGLNILTGETGAGKSIIIKSLGLLCGGRAAADVVRLGASSASIAATFDLAASMSVIKRLEALGIPLEEENGHYALILRRVISAKGRSAAWLNDLPVTVSTLSEIGAGLLDVFGQHENHKLLDQSQHTGILDCFLPDGKVLGHYQEQYSQFNELLSGLRHFIANAQRDVRDLDYLEFRHGELESFHPEPGEYAELKEKAASARAISKTFEKLTSCSEIIDRGYQGESVSRAIWQVSKDLASVEQDSMQQLADSAAALADAIDGLSFKIGNALSEPGQSTEELDAAEERLARYQELARKHQCESPEELSSRLEILSTKLTSLRDLAAAIKDRLEQLCKLSDFLTESAAQLSNQRRAAAKKVQKVVEKELGDLGMARTKFVVAFEPVQRNVSDLDIAEMEPECAELWAQVAEKAAEISESGTERARFLMAANAGEKLLHLHKFASGGEVARVMLALKRALAAGAETFVMVFDEIDTGISGKVADMVGRKMSSLAKQFQVICISHLPQVAAYADRHFLIRKESKGKRTETRVFPLTQNQQVEELARLLAGADVTKSSLGAARDLIKSARI